MKDIPVLPEVSADDQVTFDEARGWAMLGQWEPAEAFFLAVPLTDRTRSVAARKALLGIYEGQRRYEDIVRIGQSLIASCDHDPQVVISTTVALTFLGRNGEARETLDLMEGVGEPPEKRAYQRACLASLEGEFHEALRWLEIEARTPQYLDARSIGDSDLYPLWRWIARGGLRLEDAHRLFEIPLRGLCAEALDPRREIKLDENDLRQQPARFRTLFKYCRGAGLCVLDPIAMQRSPKTTAAFRKARRAHLRKIAALIAEGYRRALDLVLAAQPRYAAEQAALGNHLAVRYHLTFALAHRPSMLDEFRLQLELCGLRSLLDGFAEAERLDPGFCGRMEKVFALGATDAAWTLLEQTPATVRRHPLYLLRRAGQLTAGGDAGEALALCLEVCGAWPRDPAGFANAANALMHLGRWDDAAQVLARAPQIYRRFQLFQHQQDSISRRADPGCGASGTVFRGQRNLGEILCAEQSGDPAASSPGKCTALESNQEPSD